MSESDTGRKNGLKRTKPAIIAGALLAGLFGAVLAGSQALSPAVAQQGVGGGAGTNGAAARVYYPSNYGMPPGTISTSGTATTKVAPDKFSVTLGVETNGTTASDATSSNSDKMTKVIAALKALGIRDDEIGTSNFNVYPVYDYAESAKLCPQIYPQAPYCQPTQVITSYHASNSVIVTLDSSGSIDAGKVIDTSVTAGANNIAGVTFFVSPDLQQSIKDGLIQQAVANARHSADTAATALGTKVSGVQSVNLNDMYFPIYNKAFGNAESAPMNSAATPIQPAQQDVSVTVGVVFYFAQINGTSSIPVPGMAATMGNTNCNNPPGGPMIC